MDKTPVEWSSLKNYEAFSLSPDGSFPMIKISKIQAVSLSDREVHIVGSGHCYRISLFNHSETKSRCSLPGHHRLWFPNLRK